MKWRIRKMMKERKKSVDQELVEARAERMESEQQLAITEAKRATEIRLVQEPLQRSRIFISSHNHVVEAIRRQITQGG